uniref:Uncharacterized protein n=1 Tax=Lepeophtheirus salmonis TaxID=72036 RepID=A0A0K2UPZ3_LEPSM
MVDVCVLSSFFFLLHYLIGHRGVNFFLTNDRFLSTLLHTIHI